MTYEVTKKELVVTCLIIGFFGGGLSVAAVFLALEAMVRR